MAQPPLPKPVILWTARIITTIVSIGLAEGVLWLGGFPTWRGQQISPTSAMSQYQADPELGWTNRPGIYSMIAPDGAKFRYTNWPDGRRATTQQEPAASDPRPRFVFVGDSYVYGYGLSDSETFAWLVQQRHPELEVENLGTPGYGTYQSLLTMQRLLAADPRPTNFVYLFNGFHEARNAADPTWIRARSRSANGVFFPYAILRDGSLEALRTNGDIIWPISQHLRTAAMVEEYYERAEAWTRVRNRRALTEALLVKMGQVARFSGAKFTVVLFDDLQQADWRAYREFLSSHAIAFVSCDLPELSKPGYRQPDGHPNAKMSDLLSQCVDPTSTVARAF